MGKVFDWFKSEVKAGDVVYITTDGIISDLIGEAQTILDKTWTAKVTHVGFITKDGKVAESTFKWKFVFTKKFPFIGLHIESGARVSPIDAWKKPKYKFLFIQRFTKLSQEQIVTVSEQAERYVNAGLKYPIIELIGTLVAYANYVFLGWIRWMSPKFIDKCRRELLNKKNPFDRKNEMYCIAFVSACYRSAGFRLVQQGLNESISYVGAGMRSPNEFKLMFNSGDCVVNYNQPENSPFDFGWVGDKLEQ